MTDIYFDNLPTLEEQIMQQRRAHPELMPVALGAGWKERTPEEKAEAAEREARDRAEVSRQLGVTAAVTVLNGTASSAALVVAMADEIASYILNGKQAQPSLHVISEKPQ